MDANWTRESSWRGRWGRSRLPRIWNAAIAQWQRYPLALYIKFEYAVSVEIVHFNAAEYRKWRARLGPADVAHVRRRLALLEEQGIEIGLPNVKQLSQQLWELRVPTGARLYFTVDDDMAVFVKYGNKDTQSRDIEVATRRTQELHQNEH